MQEEHGLRGILMARYKVITTTYCGNCKHIRKCVEDNQLKDFEFIDANSPEGKELIKQYSLRTAGVIIDTELGHICPDINEFI